MKDPQTTHNTRKKLVYRQTLEFITINQLEFWIHRSSLVDKTCVCKSICIKECYPILFYHLKKSLYYLYHTILQYLPHPKTLFLLKYYSLIFFYYFFLTDIFFRPGVIPFSWAFQPYFLSLVYLNL